MPIARSLPPCGSALCSGVGWRQSRTPPPLSPAASSAILLALPAQPHYTTVQTPENQRECSGSSRSLTVDSNGSRRDPQERWLETRSRKQVDASHLAGEVKGGRLRFSRSHGHACGFAPQPNVRSRTCSSTSDSEASTVSAIPNLVADACRSGLRASSITAAPRKLSKQFAYWTHANDN